MRARFLVPLALCAAAAACAAIVASAAERPDPPKRDTPRPEVPAADPVTVTGSIAWVAGADSTVKLGTGITVSGWAAGLDTVRYQYYRHDTLLVTRRSIGLRDSITTPAPPYGVGWTFKGCAQVERGGRSSGVRYPETRPCWSWTYTRPRPVGSIDSLWRLTSIIIRPLGPPLGLDAGGRCASWQAAHPTSSVWVEEQVNAKAVPECTDSSTGQLVVWQHCAFAELEDTAHQVLRVLTVSSKAVPFCEGEYQQWLGEVTS